MAAPITATPAAHRMRHPSRVPRHASRVAEMRAASIDLAVQRDEDPGDVGPRPLRKGLDSIPKWCSSDLIQIQTGTDTMIAT